MIAINVDFLQVFCEVTKQISNYSLQYFSGGHYPVPQTIIVVLGELVKLVATIGRSKCTLPSFSVQSLRSSLRFLLPSVLYAINNNIYYAGLTLVPPPIWLILCSIRTVVTAMIYKVWKLLITYAHWGKKQHFIQKLPRIEKCDFYEKCDFENVNFVKNEILKMWIL